MKKIIYFVALIISSFCAHAADAPANACIDSDYSSPDVYIGALEHKHQLSNPNLRNIAVTDESIKDGCTEYRSDRYLALSLLQIQMRSNTVSRNAIRWILCKSPELLLPNAGYSSKPLDALNKAFPALKKLLENVDIQWLGDECDEKATPDREQIRPFLITAGEAFESFGRIAVDKCAIGGHGYDDMNTYNISETDLLAHWTEKVNRFCKTNNGTIHNDSDWQRFQEQVRLAREEDKDARIRAAKSYIYNVEKTSSFAYFSQNGFVSQCPKRRASRRYDIGSATFECLTTGVSNTLYFDKQGRQQRSANVPDFSKAEHHFIQKFYGDLNKERRTIYNRCLSVINREVGTGQINSLKTDIDQDVTTLGFRCIGAERLLCSVEYEIDPHGALHKKSVSSIATKNCF